MDKLTFEDIEERCRDFAKYIYDNYSNPSKITKFLETEFEKKGLMCGFNWIPNHEYHGEITVIFIMLNKNASQLTRSRIKGPLAKRLKLQNFIYDYFNPQGAYLLEKIRFQLGG